MSTVTLPRRISIAMSYTISNFLFFVYCLHLTVNEPWEYTPIDALKDFYWASYQIVQRDVPHWITVFHDSFRLSFNIWGKFMVNCPNYAMDTHIYQAWFEAGTPASFQEQACSAGANLKLFEDAGVPIVSYSHSTCTLSHLQPLLAVINCYLFAQLDCRGVVACYR